MAQGRIVTQKQCHVVAHKSRRKSELGYSCLGPFGCVLQCESQSARHERKIPHCIALHCRGIDKTKQRYTGPCSLNPLSATPHAGQQSQEAVSTYSRFGNPTNRQTDRRAGGWAGGWMGGRADRFFIQESQHQAAGSFVCLFVHVITTSGQQWCRRLTREHQAACSWSSHCVRLCLHIY